MPDFDDIIRGKMKLQGLTSSDRTEEEKKAIAEQEGVKPKEKPLSKEDINIPEIKVENSPALHAKKQFQDTQMQQNEMPDYQRDRIMQIAGEQKKLYDEAIEDFRNQYGVNRNSVNTNARDYINNIANDVSSYYKRYKWTDYLPENEIDYKYLASEYDARKQAYGEDAAAIWLDNQFKDTVGNNQSWWEQAMYGASHLIPTMEGGAIQLAGNIYGAFAGLGNPDLDWSINRWIDGIIDNPITRYGRDVEHAGASHVVQGLENLLGISDETVADRIAKTKATATKYNPDGIGADAIVTTSDQDDSYVSSATPWQALQSGGFTALSMLTGTGLATGSKYLFSGLSKGVMGLHNAGVVFKKYNALKKGLEGVKKVQNATDMFAIPSLVGSMEGAMEGLNTKIGIEQEQTQQLNDFYQEKIAKEAQALYENPEYNPMTAVTDDSGHSTVVRKYTPEQVFSDVWKKYEDEYTEARRQIDWASSAAGVQNFWANSLINGMINQTLKAGIMAPRVQETLRNSKMFGWAYRNPRFNIGSDGVTVTPKMSKVGSVLQILKEPFGEGLEEYAQSISNDIFTGAAENNINEFIENKFNGDGSAKIGDTFGSDYSAALKAGWNSLSNKESIQSAILGAVGSAMGTVGGIGRGYHRDENGNLVRNSAFSPSNLKRGLNEKGERESVTDYLRRVTPWRSGLVNAYYDRRKEVADANETAATLTEWLKDPTNKAKWDGLAGTANWLTQMQNAAESNDQFSYRKAQMGKAINDIIMLMKLKGTPMYESLMQDLQRAASFDATSAQAKDMIDVMRKNGGEEYESKSDAEIADKVKSNATKMLGLMSKVENESRNLDRLLGRVDEDTKQSLIYGKIMEENHRERKAELEEKIADIKSKIGNSTGRSTSTLSDDQKKLILEYGSIRNALKAQSSLQEEKDKVDARIKELEAVNKDKRDDAQKKELLESKAKSKRLDKQLKQFDPLKLTDKKGRTLKDEDGNPLNLYMEDMTLNEEEIMNLDPTTRAVVLAQGSAKLYNATHQNRQKVDQLNMELDELEHKMDELEAQKKQMTNADGKAKKHKFKQVKKTQAKIEELDKQRQQKLRELNTEQGKMDTKQIYSDAQQAVIDNLVQQGMALDENFLDDVVDIARMDRAIKDYHTQYQAILSDPKAFSNYVQRAKWRAQNDLVRRRAERVASIQNYQEFAQELDRLTANASDAEMNVIFSVLNKHDLDSKRQGQKMTPHVTTAQGDDIAIGSEVEVTSNGAKSRGTVTGEWEEDDGTHYITMDQEDGTTVNISDNDAINVLSGPQNQENQAESNLDRYRKNLKDQSVLVDQFSKNPNLTDNDRSLLMDAMQYLSSKGIDVTNENDARNALLERDEEGNWGGKFRQYVEAKNDARLPQQRTVMPAFTSIGQIVTQYVDMLNGKKRDDALRQKGNPEVHPVETPSSSTTVVNNPTPSQTPTTPEPEPQNNPPSSPQPSAPQQGKAPGIFGQLGNNSPEDGQFTDDNGTVATSSQASSAQQQEEKGKEQQGENNNTSPLVDAMMQIMPEQYAKQFAVAETIIANSNVSDEVKDLATQYLMEMGVTSSERIDDIDDVLDLMQQQIDKLNRQSDMQENKDNKFSQAAGVLRGVYNSLKVYKIKHKGRSIAMRPNERVNTKSGWIHSANIAFMEKENPNAWAVQFSNEHDIDRWNLDENHKISLKEPVYFLTNSDWNAEVEEQMNGTQNGRKYEPLVDMPLVAAVRVETPTSSTIEVNGLYYQPIAVMPSSKSKVNGAELTTEIRKKASKDSGVQLVTRDGLPNSSPLITHVYGVNYIEAHHPDAGGYKKRDNSASNNSDVISLIVDTMPFGDQERVGAMSQDDMLHDSAYQRAKVEFINRLVWIEGTNSSSDNNVGYTPDNLKDKEKGHPSLVFRRALADTRGRTTGRLLGDVIEHGSAEEVKEFNSRTQGLYDEVLRPMFQYIPKSPNSPQNHKGDPFDRSAKIITQADINADGNAVDKECQRLASLLNDFGTGDKGYRGKHVGDYLFFSNSGWKFEVTCPNPQVGADVNSSSTSYDVYMVSEDRNAPKIKVGTINAGQRDTNAAMELERNIIKVGMDNRIMGWQVTKQDIKDLNSNDSNGRSKARQTIGDMVDDGIFEIAASQLQYDVDGIKLQTPVRENGMALYNEDGTVNRDNATSATTQNATPQTDSGAATKDGSQVEADSGVAAGDNNNRHSQSPSPASASTQETEKYKKAKAITEKIVAESKDFILSEDETYYYVEDKNTGRRVKYLRVTTVIGADIAAEQWYPTKDEVAKQLGIDGNYTKVSLVDEASIKAFAEQIGRTPKEVKRAIAELRTEHKKNMLGVWSTPSTLIGNTVDHITRDFFSGNVQEHYPNITDEALSNLVKQLTLFKNNLDAKGITIVSEGVTAHGNITVTNADGTAREVPVAGTLDLFGYDKDGNFYIFDMKTLHNHNASALDSHRAKWARQVSLYADLLEQTYGIKISPENLRIIPIDVSYPTPAGSRKDYLDPAGPTYSEGENGQLTMTPRGKKEGKPFMESEPKMRFTGVTESGTGQYAPSRVSLNIAWDNLSAEDQDIADALTLDLEATLQEQDAQASQAEPAQATVEKPQDDAVAPFQDPLAGGVDFSEFGENASGSQPVAPTPPPAPTPTSSSETTRKLMPKLKKLSKAAKNYLREAYDVKSEKDYEELVNDPTMEETLYKELHCRGMI